MKTKKELEKEIRKLKRMIGKMKRCDNCHWDNLEVHDFDRCIKCKNRSQWKLER